MSTRHSVELQVVPMSGQQVRKRLKSARKTKGFRMKPGYIYTVVRAISARVNQNYDGWPSDELKKAAHTFIGKPVFVNHENEDPTKARGVVVAARYVENGNDKYIECVQEVDARRFPKLAHEIKTGGLDSVSMGAEAGFTICSYCGNKAVDEPDFCDHVKYHKGQTLPRWNRRTGKKEEVLVYESCHKLGFFELSYVFDPADETSVATKVLVASVKDRAKKASFEDRVLRTAGVKQAWEDCPPGVVCEKFPESLSGGTGAGGAPAGGAPAGGGSAGGGGSPAAAGGSPIPGIGGPPVFKKPDGTIGSPDPAWQHLIDRESGGRNIPQGNIGDVNNASGDLAKGYFQITDATWNSHGGGAYGPNAMAATPEQQAAVAGNILRANPSGSDWGAGLSGRENASALASGLSQPAQPAGASGQPATQTQDKAASFERAVLRPAGLRTAEKCHYCNGDAEEGFKSCPGHRAMEHNKFPKKSFEAMVLEAAGVKAPPPENSQRTQRPGTASTYAKAHAYFDQMGAPHSGLDGVLDYGAGLGHSAQFGHTYEPYPREDRDFQPTYVDPDEIPEGAFHRVTNLHVLNVVPPNVRDQVVDGIGRAMAPGGHALIVTRGGPGDVDAAKNKIPVGKNDPGAYYIGNPARPETMTYQKGFHPDELHSYVQSRLGDGYTVSPVPTKEKVGPAAVHIVKNAGKTASFDQQVRRVAGIGDEHSDLSWALDGYKQHRDNTYGGVDSPHAFDHYIDQLNNSMGGLGGDDEEKLWGYVKNRMDSPGLGPWGLDRQDPHGPYPKGEIPSGKYEVPNALQPGNRLSFKDEVLHMAGYKQAWGEVEAPTPVDTLREEGSAPEDDTNDFEHYVEPPKELQAPDLSQAAQVDREQEEAGTPPDQMGGQPAPGADTDTSGDDGQYMILKIPVPQPQQQQVPQQDFSNPPPTPVPAAPPAGPPPPQQAPPAAGPMPTAAKFDDFFRRYYGHRVDSTLVNAHEHHSTNRNTRKGTAMGNGLVDRGKVASRGRRQHFAADTSGHTDGGPYGRNDEGEQEEAFINSVFGEGVPPPEPVEAPSDGERDIRNTENNLVARVQQGRQQLLRDAQQLAALRSRTGSRRTAEEVAEVVDPSLTQTTGPAAEALTGDMEPANPNAGVVETNPKNASLDAFAAFDRWLQRESGYRCRDLREAAIKRAAEEFSVRTASSVQSLFPALSIVLREARKNEAAIKAAAKNRQRGKGAAMRKRADEKLEVAAPDARIDVERPVADETDADAQASQFDLRDYGNNAGDNIAKPDMSTDQNWAPGDGKKSSRQRPAGELLAMRCAEAMIEAGLEPNNRAHRYQLAQAFAPMARGAVLDRIAMAERFVQVRTADHQVYQNEMKKVASGGNRGATRSPVPIGLTQGVARTASTRRTAVNDPHNDALLFG